MYGTVCLRDVDIATGEVSPRADDQAKDLATIEAAFNVTGFSELEAVAEEIEQACAYLDHIDAALAERFEVGHFMGVEKLPKILRQAAKVVRDQLLRHPGRVVERAEQGDGPDLIGEREGGPAATSGARGEINSRDDVARTLDRICDYYALEEPGSPVPILLQRAKRLINMNFIELMAELSPQGLAEISFLVGLKPEARHDDVDAMEAFSLN
jgi:type VI secretion system protein ImpA